MKRSPAGLIFSPSDLVRYLSSPFASWMDRYYLESPAAVSPDEETEDKKLIAATGDQHEQTVLKEFKNAGSKLVEVSRKDFATAQKETLAAIKERAPIIYQAALSSGRFAGLSDFLMLDPEDHYQVWDTKLARSPRPYYAIQLCCYSEMLAEMTGTSLPERFGIILGTKEKVEFRTEDFIHYYHQLKKNFLALQDGFTGKLPDRPEPLPRADHGRWASHAENYFLETDHLVQVAGINTGQVKKLKRAGITTMAALSNAKGQAVPNLASDSLQKLVAQASLQCQTRTARKKNPEAPARYELLPLTGPQNEPLGLATLPPDHPADVFFDMEGYPLIDGGLEYLFGACIRDKRPNTFIFKDWWAHDREEEKRALDAFVTWVHKRWKENPGMHIYHYAAYEVSALSRLSTRHDTCQDEVDDLLRAQVFVDLYQMVRHSLRIGEDSYSIKKVERLYRPKRATEVATASESIVYYARWLESGEPRNWERSEILRNIRSYNEDDCRSTAELLQWLRKVAAEERITAISVSSEEEVPETEETASGPNPDIEKRKALAKELREKGDLIALLLADLLDFHRREEKPMWWRMFKRAVATSDELRDDPGCIQGATAVGDPVPEKRSFLQTYTFDPAQECKLAAGDRSQVMFTHNLRAKFSLTALDILKGTLALKASGKMLRERSGGKFPKQGSLQSYEYLSAKPVQIALTEVASGHLSGTLHPPVGSLLLRTPPASPLQKKGESTLDAAIRITRAMSGGCLVIQGPPGTGKTYTASRVIAALLAADKKVGIASNSHKAVINLVSACGDAAREKGMELEGIKVGGDPHDRIFDANCKLEHVAEPAEAFDNYSKGVVGATAWLFSRPEWEGALDFLFIDEAGQVSLANAVAMSRCAENLVLLGDQMQLEQPVQGSHPGDAGLSALQYALKDTEASRPDVPVFHAVVPADAGLFLGQSRRMHPAVCRFISESIYEGRLASYPNCAKQKIVVPRRSGLLVTQEAGIVFSGVEHENNIQQSDEEVARVLAIYKELLGRSYTDKDGISRKLVLDDLLFISPYNAQVRALQAVLPSGARVGSVDKFQGQEAPVCILSLCSSYGEYGSRGLGFILDRNRVNVAISRAQCLAVVAADPRIASASANSLGEMQLLNLFCRLVNG